MSPPFPFAFTSRQAGLAGREVLLETRCHQPRFTAADHFAVLEHGYNVMFDPEQFRADKVEVLRVRLGDKLNFAYGGAEGFVLASDVVIE